MDVIRKNYPELPAPGAPHYQSVRVGNMLFLSGATARDTEAEYGDMAAQTDVILNQFRDGNLPRSRSGHPPGAHEILWGQLTSQHTGPGRRVGGAASEDRDRGHGYIARL